MGRLRDLVSWQWTRGASGPAPPHTPFSLPPQLCAAPALLNGGHCVSGSAQPCRCPPGFQGPRCQHGECAHPGTPCRGVSDGWGWGVFWCPDPVLQPPSHGCLCPIIRVHPHLLAPLCGWGQWAWRQTGMNQGPGSAGKRLVPGVSSHTPTCQGLLSFMSEVGGHGPYPHACRLEPDPLTTGPGNVLWGHCGWMSLKQVLGRGTRNRNFIKKYR